MAKNSRIIEDIDEAAMLQSIYERDNPPAASPQQPQEQPVASPEEKEWTELSPILS